MCSELVAEPSLTDTAVKGSNPPANLLLKETLDFYFQDKRFNMLSLSGGSFKPKVQLLS